MTEFVTVPAPVAEIERDRWGRPLIVPPGGGKPIAYRRCTSYIDVLSDKFNLQQWMQRMVALGLASRTDLLLAVQTNREDKAALNRICTEAREAAGAVAAATTGTALHSLSELVDRGEDLPALPPGAAASMEAYRAAVAPLKVRAMEQFVVLDTLKVGGTFDRLVEFEGETYIADLKTGQSLDFDSIKLAMQLAIYSRSQHYDPATGERTPVGASFTRGIIIHCPATDDPAQARAELHWVDLETGWEAVKVAEKVWAQRAVKKAQVLAPFGAPARGSLRLEKRDEARAAEIAEAEVDRLARIIRACETADQVRALWADNSASWTDALTEIAREHIAGLPAA